MNIILCILLYYTSKLIHLYKKNTAKNVNGYKKFLIINIFKWNLFKQEYYCNKLYCNELVYNVNV